MVYEQIAVHVGDLRDAIIPEDSGIPNCILFAAGFRLGSLARLSLEPLQPKPAMTT